MRFEIWLTVSFICYVAMLIGTFVISRLPYRKARLITPNRVLVTGTFISAVILLLPFYLEKLFEDKGLLEYVKAIIISAIHSIKLFAFDTGYANCFESDIIRNLEPTLRTLYSGFGALLYVWAPIMTMKIVISFFRDASAYLKYVFSFRKHTHVFSALNEKSFALAKSIDKKYNMSERNPNKYKLLRKEFFVFCGVPAQDGKSELVERARELGAVCFAKDLNAINFLKSKRSKRELSFYLISEDEKDNVRHAESTMRSYDLPKVDLRVFSSDVRAELLLAVKDVKDIRVVRVNEARSLIYHHLDVHGHRLFEKARLGENGEKVISIVIVGLGKYGLEMAKALTWFCQMDGYRVKIKAFDKNKSARDSLSAMCPGLMDENVNGAMIPGEAQYEIDVVGGVDINSKAFFEELEKLTDTTYVLVALGDDTENLRTATNIRSIFERIKCADPNFDPDIETIIYDSTVCELMSEKWQGEEGAGAVGVKNFRNQPYRIHMIGNLDQLYSVDTMLDSKLIGDAEAENEHYAKCKYETEMKDLSSVPENEREAKIKEIEERKEANLQAFNKYEYNFSSSLARIIHRNLREKLAIDNTEIEHRRWCAYMRTEGYQYSGSDKEESRNDLAKLHNDLIPFVSLDESNQLLDEFGKKKTSVTK